MGWFQILPLDWSSIFGVTVLNFLSQRLTMFGCKYSKELSLEGYCSRLEHKYQHAEGAVLFIEQAARRTEPKVLQRPACLLPGETYGNWILKERVKGSNDRWKMTCACGCGVETIDKPYRIKHFDPHIPKRKGWQTYR